MDDLTTLGRDPPAGDRTAVRRRADAVRPPPSRTGAGVTYRPGMSTPLPRIDTVPGPLLARGREATIHRLGAGAVLRRYDDARDVTVEVAVMQHVARHGLRVPAVHGLHVDAAGRATGMVLERIEGPSLVEAAVGGAVDAGDVGRTLARLHGDLHRVPVTGLPSPPGWPPPRPGDAVVHLDLHPANVLLDGTVPVVIDWAIARTGPATLDTALTALTLAAAALAGVPADAGDVATLTVPRALVREVLVAYLGALPVPPTPSLTQATAVLDRIGAQPPAVVRAAGELVLDVLGSAATAGRPPTPG